MSGPITAGYFFTHGMLVLIARALQEARAMKREYADVLAELQRREAELAQARAGLCAARVERVAAVRNDAARQRGRAERLRALASTATSQAPELAARIPAALPAAPEADDDAAWNTHLGELEAAIRDLEGVLAQVGGDAGVRVQAALAGSAAAPSIDDVLSAYVLERHLAPGLDAAESERFRQTASRVLARLELDAGAALPVELEALARSIVLAPSVERAEALASQLRLAVQRQRESRAAQAEEATEARQWLDAFGESAPVPLLRALERVAAGVDRMDATLRRTVQDLLDGVAADRGQAEQEAAAYVLEQSLRDLGYEVQDIGATLFVDGGTVHFRRQGWDNYFVRLRVDANERTVNFNVVRARGDEENAERRRQDALAEDRWCAEFPRLMSTLAARGLELDVRRRLEAGEVPVQVVEGSTLPRVHAEEVAARPRAPLSRKAP